MNGNADINQQLLLGIENLNQRFDALTARMDNYIGDHSSNSIITERVLTGNFYNISIYIYKH